MSNKLLEVKNLAVEYRTDLETVYAINDISFTINEGETFGLVGETGAGKSTTALSIIRLLPNKIGVVKDGSIEFNGKNLLEMDEKEMRAIRGHDISMIFQDPMTSLNPLETVGDQIAEALYLHAGGAAAKEKKNAGVFTKKMKRAMYASVEERVDEVLTLVGIPPARKVEYPHQFSGGMKQRIVIAIALACEPKLLIADEPTTALDVTIQAQVLAMIDELKQKLNTSMIMITHDLGIVAQTCDKVAVMYAGELVECGTVEDIFDSDKHHPYTNGLFGSIPDIENETSRLAPINGLMPDPTDLPIGCKFADRCPNCMPICCKKHPGDFVDGTHTIKCFLYNGEVE